jgi:hypothetical protein
MNIQHVFRTGAAALSFTGLIGFALAPLATAADSDHDHDRVTLIGCVQPERGYHEGVWSGHEDNWVLANATPISAGQPLPSSIADESCDTATPGAYMYRLTGHGGEHLGQFVGRRVVVIGELEDYHWGHWDHSEIQGAMQGVWLRYFGKLPKMELGTIQEYVPPVTANTQR